MRDILKSAGFKRVIVVSTLLFWCFSMVVVRLERTGSGYYRFLLGNLFLACIPLFLSTVLRIANRWQLPRIIQLGLFSLWGFARKVGSLAVLVSLRISVYLCVLCVKTFAPIYLTQSTQRYAEKVPQT